MAAIVRAVGRLAVVCFVLSGIDCAQGDVNSRSQRHAALTLLTDDVLRTISAFDEALDPELDGEVITNVPVELTTLLAKLDATVAHTAAVVGDDSDLPTVDCDDALHTTDNTVAATLPPVVLQAAIRQAAALRSYIVKEQLFRKPFVTSAMVEAHSPWLFQLVAAVLNCSTVDPNAAGPLLHTPLQLASGLGLSEVVGMLLAKGADPNGSLGDAYWLSPLHHAVRRQDMATITLLDQANASWASEDVFGRQPGQLLAELLARDELIAGDGWGDHAEVGSSDNSALEALARARRQLHEDRGAARGKGDESGGWLRGSAALVARHTASEWCPIRTVDEEAMTPEQFVRDHATTGRPVAIATSPATKQRLADWFSRQNLVDTLGAKPVTMAVIPYATVFGQRQEQTMVDKFAKYMDRLAEQQQEQTTQNPTVPLYVFDHDILTKNAQGTQWTAPAAIHDTWPDRTNNTQFFLGPPGSGAPSHHHHDAVNVLAYGRKLWVLSPPSAEFYSKLPPGARKNVAETEHEVPGQRPMVCVQYPGEALYVPTGWVHSTYNLDQVVGYAVEFDHDTSCPDQPRQMAAAAANPCPTYTP
eukprot:m.140746 g.140746  ORF g.140746 m.140746 type:complete len:588 (-) comp17093_c0_seq2:157-1920(-)